MKRIIAEIEDKKHHQFKLKTLKENKSISEVIIAFIDKYLKGKTK